MTKVILLATSDELKGAGEGQRQRGKTTRMPHCVTSDMTTASNCMAWSISMGDAMAFATVLIGTPGDDLEAEAHEWGERLP